MSKIFIGGSRHVSRLAPEVRERLDIIMEKNLNVIVGDANGADKAVQQYLFKNRYENVEVFCSGSVCRNNVGHWPSRNINTDMRSAGYQFYAAKDRAMAEEAAYGLMLWDGKSTGTLLNVLRLLRLDKKVVLYTVSARQFLDLKAIDHWHAFLAALGDEVRSETERKAKLEDREVKRFPQPTLPLTPA